MVLTCPLDAFSGEPFGALGLARDPRALGPRTARRLRPGRDGRQLPGHEYPFIRIHETKHASRQECEGTVLGFEFTGAPTRYYPIELPRTGRSTTATATTCSTEIGPATYFAGRLANYVYIDMDDCMRQALDVAEELLATL